MPESLLVHRLDRQINQAVSNVSTDGTLSRPVCPDDLSRQVFGVMGLPLDALDLPVLLKTVSAAVDAKAPFLLSTPNVNFLMMSRSDAAFRESLLQSDLCAVDGMPLIWIARLMGIPIKTRLSGSDIFDALRSRKQTGRQFNVFLFGGAESIAETVAQKMNAEPDGMKCVGTLNPGFGSVEDMSSDHILQTINASDADLLTVFLSARKAQGWLLLNHDRVQVPVRAQFGTTINLQAGKIKRAPVLWQRLGFEWLWRIKEEPYLWRRYWNDGGQLLKLLVTRVMPLSIGGLWRRLVGPLQQEQLRIDLRRDQEAVRVKLTGAAVLQHVDLAVSCFRNALDEKKNVLVDVTDTRQIDARFFGLFLMVRKRLIGQGRRLDFQGMTPHVTKMFRLNGFEFLLNSEH